MQTPVFDKTDDLILEIEEGNEYLYRFFKKYNTSFESKNDLMKEWQEEKRIMENNKLKKKQNLELSIYKDAKELNDLKQKNTILISLKNKLLQERKEKLYKYKNKKFLTFNDFDTYEIEENKNTIPLYQIYIKVKEILLNPEIETEKYLNSKKLYDYIKETKTSKEINFNGEFISKPIFCLKILEVILLKLFQDKNKYLNNPKNKINYLKMKSEREKMSKINKFKQIMALSKLHLEKRNEKIIKKINKFPTLQNRKLDPYYKYYIYKKINESSKKAQKEEYLRLRLEAEANKYNNYLLY
jgi:hypothetical protein